MTIFVWMCLIGWVSLASGQEGGVVVGLTEKTFDEAIQRHPFVLVEFYAPWCGHCRQLEPEFVSTAEQLSDLWPEVLVAKVDSTVEEELTRRFDVRGYPTLKFFRNGKYVMDYELGRTANDLVSFMRKKSVPLTTTLKTEKEIKDFLATNPSSLITFAPADSDVLLSAREVAGKQILEDFVFGEVTDPVLVKRLGEKMNTVKVYRSFASDDPHVVLHPTNQDSIFSAVLAYGYPLVNNGVDAWERVVQRKVPIIVLFADMQEKETDSILAWFTKLAEANIDTLAFVYADKDFHSRLPLLGASGNMVPTIVAVDAETTKSWPFNETQQLTQENVQVFINGILDGTLRPHYASQTPPAENNGPVLTVVGDTFEELVLNNDKDVVIQFYAPWCGHCKQLAPTWENLGQHFAGSKDVIVAQIDASANDNPSVAIHGYPTIYLFPAEGKHNLIEYQGLTRTLQDLISFVEENARKRNKEGTHDEL